MILKIVKYTFIFCLALLILLVVGSVITGFYWGRDVDSLRLEQATAQRDDQGIWEIKAPDRDALWYAFGRLQAQDRYFQIELTRHAALGRLAELMGDEAVSRDRLSRVLAGMALREFETKSKDSDIYRSAKRYADGVNAWRQLSSSANPIEFKVLGLSVTDLPAWEPWHVYAISYLQAWMFSYDLADENRHAELLDVKGKKWIDFFDGREIAVDGINLYSQPGIAGHLKRPSQSYPLDKFQKVTTLPREVLELPELYKLSGDGEKSASHYPRIPAKVQLGASNAWIGYNPTRSLGPILCNDPHLKLMWPSTLYPIKYAMGELKTSGWMLPGQPFVVMGGSEDARRMYAWGITLANYANVQDRVYVGTKELSQSTKFSTKIRVRNPRTFVEKIVNFDEQWTPWGPLGSEWFEGGAKKDKPWAIDWIGFRGAEPPYNYFIEQNFDLAIDTANKIASTWQTPVVNVHWIAKDKAKKSSTWGHIVTGMIFSSNGETRDHTGTAISSAHERLYYTADSRTPDLSFLSSANQQVWNSASSRTLAREWGSPLRARRILEKRDDNFNTLGFSQIDDHSLLSHGFVQWARRRLDVTRLCSEGASELMSRCQTDLAALDAWSGAMAQDDWRPSLVSLWLSNLKWKMWITKNAAARGAEVTSRTERELKAFVQWARSGASQKLIWDLAHDKKFAAQLKTQFKLDLDSLVQSAFTEAYALLETSLGPDRSLWNWANLHRVAWQHPMLRILGPNLPFVGPSLSGADDTPQRASSEWDPRYPLLFPVVHAAVQRSCYDASGDQLQMQWTGITGPSGNPFSKWSQTFSKEFYFASKWVNESFFTKK